MPPSEIVALDGESLAYLDAWAEGRMIGEWTHGEGRETGKATPGVGGGLPYGPA